MQRKKSAKALEDAYAAEQEAEKARAEKEKATQEADVIVKVEIDKRKKELEAEAEAEQMRRKARGEAEAIYAKMEAEARGVQAMLNAQATGIKKIVEAANGDAANAVRLMVADKLEEIVAKQVEAIKNIKIDKVTVWDSGTNADGKTGTSNFLSGMMKSLPPLTEMFDMAGLTLPEFIKPNAVPKAEEVPAEKVKE